MADLGNPFQAKSLGLHGRPIYAYDATSRIEQVKEFGLEECRAALRLAASGKLFLQKVVRQRIEARLRRLEKGAKP